MKKQTTKKASQALSKEVINSQLDKRSSLLKKDNNSKTADLIQKDIQGHIRKHFNEYEVDFILETWTRFGAAPQLVYDDNGMFAVTDDGYSPVVTSNQRIEGAMTCFPKKNQWKKTIRQALKLYITRK